jgi:hypothetical protein
VMAFSSWICLRRRHTTPQLRPKAAHSGELKPKLLITLDWLLATTPVPQPVMIDGAVTNVLTTRSLIVRLSENAGGYQQLGVA